MAYVIQKGDTLSQIARNNNTTVSALLAANPQISDPNLIRAGASLNLNVGGSTPASASRSAAGSVSGTAAQSDTEQVRNGVYGYGSQVSTLPSVQNSYGYVHTGNAVSPWKSISERNASIDAWTNQGGFGGYDGMGGVFNEAGYSNNPYFLQGTAGVSRDQLRGTAAEHASDEMIRTVLQAEPIYAQSDNFYVYSDGTFGNVARPGAISSRAILDAIANARGITVNHGEYLDPVGFYDGQNWEAAPAVVTAQQLMDPGYQIETAPVGNGSVMNALTQNSAPQAPAPAVPVQKNDAAQDWWEEEKLRRLTQILAGYGE